MTDAVLEIVVDASEAEAGAARAVRALDDIRRGAADVEGQVGGLGRRLAEGGDAVAASLDDAARAMAALERAAGGLDRRLDGAGWTGGLVDAVDGAATRVGGFFDGLVAGGEGAARGLLDIFGRLGAGLGRMFGGGGTLDIGGLLGGLGRQAGSLFAGLLPAGAGFLGPLAGGLVGGLLGSLFSRAPKVPQGEYSVFLSDLATPQYASTRFPVVTDAARGVTTDLTDLVAGLERALGVRRSADPGAALGATLNEKEGLRLFYDRGAADGPDAADRAWFAADPQNEAAVEAARQGFAVAFLKDADWSAWGDELGASIATHIAGSAAATVEELTADVAFIAGFDDALGRLRSGIGDFTLSMRAAAEAAGRADAQGLTAQVTGFLDKTAQLGLPLAAATDAMRAMVETLAGVRAAEAAAPLSRLEEGTARLTAQWQGMAPVLDALGYTAEETARLIESGLSGALAGLSRDLAAGRADFLDRTGAVLEGRDTVPTADALFRALGLDPAATPDFFAAIRSALAAGATGGLTRADAAALAPRFANQYDLRRIAPEQLDRIAAVVDAAVGAAQAMRDAQGVGTATGPEAIAAARAAAAQAEIADARRAAIDAVEHAVAALGLRADAEEEAARAARRLADSFGQAAGDLHRFRDGLATGTTSPLSPGDRLAEARRQEADALARVLAGGPDAPAAARELQQAASRVQELARTVYGSSAQSNQVFATSMDRLHQAETRALSLEQQQLALAAAANEALDRIAQEVAGLRAELAKLRAGETPDAAPLPAFGVARLGRGAGEAVGTFMARRFPAYDGPATEAAALAWLQQPQGSALGASRLDYYGAATAAGYTGAFGAGGHLAYLSPAGNPDMNRWVAFIDALRRIVDVPYGFFGVPYAAGGLVAGGTPGRDSVPALLTPGERVLSVEQARLFEQLAANRDDAGAGRAIDALRGERARADEAARRDADRLEARIAMLERGTGALLAELRGLRADLRIAVGNRPAVGGR